MKTKNAAEKIYISTLERVTEIAKNAGRDITSTYEMDIGPEKFNQ